MTDQSPFGPDYKLHKVVRETERAYLVERHIFRRNGSAYIDFRWIGKSACKVDEAGNVYTPVWLI